MNKHLKHDKIDVEILKTLEMHGLGEGILNLRDSEVRTIFSDAAREIMLLHARINKMNEIKRKTFEAFIDIAAPAPVVQPSNEQAKIMDVGHSLTCSRHKGSVERVCPWCEKERLQSLIKTTVEEWHKMENVKNNFGAMVRFAENLFTRLLKAAFLSPNKDEAHLDDDDYTPTKLPVELLNKGKISPPTEASCILDEIKAARVAREEEMRIFPQYKKLRDGKTSEAKDDEKH